MELLDGIDLQSLVDRFGPMEPARVAHAVYQIAQSLDEAHRAGLVHRDIKPRNIFLARLGFQYDFAKVLDFGLVKKLRHEDPEATMTTLVATETVSECEIAASDTAIRNARAPQLSGENMWPARAAQSAEMPITAATKLTTTVVQSAFSKSAGW